MNGRSHAFQAGQAIGLLQSDIIGLLLATTVGRFQCVFFRSDQLGFGALETSLQTGGLEKEL